MERPKDEVITFKVDEKLSHAMAGIPNRSDFIRNAIYMALGNSCPLCNGAGILNDTQREHWENFNKHHHLHTCSDCQQLHLVCDHENLA